MIRYSIFACLALSACAREPSLTCASVTTGEVLTNVYGDAVIVVDLNAQTIALEAPRSHETVRLTCEQFAGIKGMKKDTI